MQRIERLRSPHLHHSYTTLSHVEYGILCNRTTYTILPLDKHTKLMCGSKRKIVKNKGSEIPQPVNLLPLFLHSAIHQLDIIGANAHTKITNTDRGGTNEIHRIDL